MLRVFDEYLREWALRADGPPIVTPRCALLPVLERDGSPAMLKSGGPQFRDRPLKWKR